MIWQIEKTSIRKGLVVTTTELVTDNEVEAKQWIDPANTEVFKISVWAAGKVIKTLLPRNIRAWLKR